MAKMQALNFEDSFCRHATVRPDGRVMRDVYPAWVKTPADAFGRRRSRPVACERA